MRKLYQSKESSRCSSKREKPSKRAKSSEEGRPTYKKYSQRRERRTFTLQFKLCVLNHLSKENNLARTAKYFGLHRDSIRQWRKQKTYLKASHCKSESTCFFKPF